MGGMTKEQYEQHVADCDNLCVITEEMVAETPNLMRCVTCPFCKATVDAILTPSTISCPACEVTVSR
jgi:hypothetical protein